MKYVTRSWCDSCACTISFTVPHPTGLNLSVGRRRKACCAVFTRERTNGLPERPVIRTVSPTRASRSTAQRRGELKRSAGRWLACIAGSSTVRQTQPSVGDFFAEAVTSYRQWAVKTNSKNRAPDSGGTPKPRRHTPAFRAGGPDEEASQLLLRGAHTIPRQVKSKFPANGSRMRRLPILTSLEATKRWPSSRVRRSTGGSGRSGGGNRAPPRPWSDHVADSFHAAGRGSESRRRPRRLSRFQNPR